MKRLKFVLKAEAKRFANCYNKAVNQMDKSKQHNLAIKIMVCLLSPIIILCLSAMAIIALAVYAGVMYGTIQRYIKRVYKRLKA